MNLTLKIVAEDYHRNGIAGEPFRVLLADVKDDDEELGRFVIVQFAEGLMYTAALNVQKLAEDNIAFGSNSWRGDHFAAALAAAETKT